MMMTLGEGNNLLQNPTGLLSADPRAERQGPKML